MIASTQSTQFVGTGKASAILGVSRQTVVNLCNAGELDCFSTLDGKGHRRISLTSLYNFMGLDAAEEKTTDKTPVAIVSRVSSNKQGQGYSKGEESDLTRQEEKNTAYANDKFGEDNINISRYSRIASGMNFSNDVFIRLTNDILDMKFSGGVIICTHPDRLIRFGRAMLENICARGNCTIVYSDEGNNKEDKSLAEELTADVIAVITHFSAKVHGQRAAKTLSRSIDDKEAIDAMLKLRNSGLGAEGIAAKLNKAGFTNCKGDKITSHVVYKALRKIENNTEVNRSPVQADTTDNEVCRWYVSKVKVLKTFDAGEKKTRLTKPQLCEFFKRDNPNTVYNAKQVSQLINAIVPADRQRKSCGKRYICGIQYQG